MLVAFKFAEFIYRFSSCILYIDYGPASRPYPSVKTSRILANRHGYIDLAAGIFLALRAVPAGGYRYSHCRRYAPTIAGRRGGDIGIYFTIRRAT